MTAEDTNRLLKLEGIADKLKRGENVQNRQLQAWLSDEEIDEVFKKTPEEIQQLTAFATIECENNK